MRTGETLIALRALRTDRTEVSLESLDASRTGETLIALRTLRTDRTDLTLRTGNTRISLRTLRSGRSTVALYALTVRILEEISENIDRELGTAPSDASVKVPPRIIIAPSSTTTSPL